MVSDTAAHRPYRVLVPLSDNEASATAQARFVGSLQDSGAAVEATLTHVLHGEELDAPRGLRLTSRVGTVAHVRDHLASLDVPVTVRDAEDPYPPAESILAMADDIDADLVVLGGGMHGFLDDLLTGDVAKSVGKRTNRPVTVVPETYGDDAA